MDSIDVLLSSRARVGLGASCVTRTQLYKSMEDLLEAQMRSTRKRSRTGDMVDESDVVAPEDAGRMIVNKVAAAGVLLMLCEERVQ